jgi:calcineurin-like phosphoesterase family protein
MLKIKKHRKDYKEILVSSDFHFGHDRDFLYGPRGFKDGKEHSEWIQEQVDNIHPDSLLINLGDVGLSCGPVRIQEFMLTFPCETLLVLGNHNSGVHQLYQQNLPPGFENCQLYPMKITPNITLLGYEFLLDIDHDRFYCTHMAPLIWPDQNKKPTPRKCLCGHSHGNLKGANPDDHGFGKLLDVGVENAKKYNNTAFFKIEEINNIMNAKPDAHFDHHG